MADESVVGEPPGSAAVDVTERNVIERNATEGSATPHGVRSSKFRGPGTEDRGIGTEDRGVSTEDRMGLRGARYDETELERQSTDRRTGTVDRQTRAIKRQVRTTTRAMSTKLPDVSADGDSRVANHAADWIGTESTAVATADSRKQCAACGDPDGAHELLLTVDWVDYLVEAHETRPPEEECVAPLCTRCRSWAEMLEIAELNLDQHGREERRTIVDERNRFLDSLSVQQISNFTVSESLSAFQ